MVHDQDLDLDVEVVRDGVESGVGAVGYFLAAAPLTLTPQTMTVPV